jgi:hypothetical protein
MAAQEMRHRANARWQLTNSTCVSTGASGAAHSMNHTPKRATGVATSLPVAREFLLPLRLHARWTRMIPEVSDDFALV